MDKPRRDDELRQVAKSLRNLEALGKLIEKWSLSSLVADDVFREIIAEYQEALTEFKDQLDRIEKMIIELSDPTSDNRQVTSKLRREMYIARIGSLKKQLKRQSDNKNILQEKEAEYGGHPPLELTTQIISVSEAIKKIEEELQYYRGLLDE